MILDKARGSLGLVTLLRADTVPPEEPPPETPPETPPEQPKAGPPVLHCVAAPFYGPSDQRGRDTWGTFFSPRTNFHTDLFPIEGAPGIPVFPSHNLSLDPSDGGFDDLRSMAVAIRNVTMTERGMEMDIELDREHPETASHIDHAEQGLVFCSVTFSAEAFRTADDGEILDAGIVGVSLVDVPRGNYRATSSRPLTYSRAVPHECQQSTRTQETDRWDSPH